MADRVDQLDPYRLAAELAHQLDATRGREWAELARRVDHVRVLARAASALTVDMLPGRTLPPVEASAASVVTGLADTTVAALVAIASLGLDPGVTLALHAGRMRDRAAEAARDGTDTVELARPNWSRWPTVDQHTRRTWPGDQRGPQDGRGGGDLD